MPWIGILTGISVLLSLATLFWCLHLVRTLKMGPPARYMIGLTGLLSIYHASRVLGEAGYIGKGNPALAEASTLLLTALYLAALSILEYYFVEVRRLRYQLRLTQASESLAPQATQVNDPRRAQVLYQAMSDSCPLAVYAEDPAGNICYWNTAAERMLGFTRSQVLGRPLPFRLNRTQTGGQVEFRDGRVLDVQSWYAPFQTSGNEIYGNLTILDSRPVTQTASHEAQPQRSAADNPSQTALQNVRCPA
ncbi:MAG: PAS domain-containing protein [Acidobacteria bacterium]|nr:PAS domain-containing protein [Acidobacteriota bacterium]